MERRLHIPDSEGTHAAASLPDLPDAAIASTRGRPWTGLIVDVHAAAAHYRVQAPARDHHLILYSTYGTGRMLQRRGGREHTGVSGPGSVKIMPAGYESLWDGTATGSARLRMPVDVLARAAEEIGGRPDRPVELRNVFETHDPVVERVAQILMGELDSAPHPAQILLVTSVSAALAAHLLRSYDAFGPVPDARGRLSARALARVVDFIESCDGRAITLDELARVAGVSRYHFGRLFKRTTGLTPIAFVERSRIRRAEVLMRRGSASLSEIALMVGFADQSHFTRRFRRVMGVTPAAFLRALG